MVLRDKRDIGRKKNTIQSNSYDREKIADSWFGRNKKLRRKYSKMKRVKLKKNLDMKLLIDTKRNNGIISPETKSKEVLCVICYESDINLKYINCKRKGVQTVNVGKYSECCKDKPICENCIQKCFKSCPFCKGHKLVTIKNRFPKKKPSFAIRQERLRLKKLKKEKRELRNRRRRRFAERFAESASFRALFSALDLMAFGNIANTGINGYRVHPGAVRREQRQTASADGGYRYISYF